jgi:RNA polymerase sigma factor (sigma-70 family)
MTVPARPGPSPDPLDHRGLAVDVARKFLARGSRCGLDLEDLVQEALLALVRAARAFDPGRDLAFSTLAWTATRRQLCRATEGTPIGARIPADTRRLMAAATPDGDDLPGRALRLEGLRRRDVARLRDRPAGPPGPWEAAEGPGPGHGAGDAPAAVRDALTTLTPRQVEVLRMRYGLDDGVGRTQRKVADRLGVTRQAVWQVERTALACLRRYLVSGAPTMDRSPVVVPPVPCACGCGRLLPATDGPGRPRYVHGHNRRRRPGPSPMVPCACGCGTMIPPRDRAGRPRRYVDGGHAVRGYTPGQGRVLGALEPGRDYPIAEIAREVGMHRKAIHSALRRLRERGLVEWARRGVWRRSDGPCCREYDLGEPEKEAS